MTGHQVTKYVIHEIPPETPRHRPYWLIALKAAGVLTTLVVVAGVGYSVAQGLGEMAGVESEAGVPAGIEVEVEVVPGSTAKSIAAQLADLGVVGDAGDFEAAVLRGGAAAQLKAGTYTMITGTTYDQLIRQLTTGPTFETYRITVIEGLTIEDMVASLAEQTPHSDSVYRSLLLTGAVGSRFLPETAPPESPALARWEGLLAPDTYEFVAEASAESILQRMADTLTERVEALDWTWLEALDLTPYDGLVLASLIEREAKLDNERPVIASVIRNRLEADIALQIDATIIYALGKNIGEVLLEDLELDSPYNTYLHSGLPPTPIGGVRTDSLNAASSPADTEYLYYVLIDFDGTHGFSETLEEHNLLKEEAKASGVLTP